MRRMAKITGRSDDMMIVRGVNVFPSQIEELILAMPKLCPMYQLILMREGHLDSLAVRVEARAEVCGSLGDDERKTLARELQHRIKTMVGVSTTVSILRTGEIPATATGKAKRVIDLRNGPKAES
jgi:phenylacetate-CoA ligase